MKKILLGLGLLSAMVLVPHSLYAGATRIIEADQIRSGAALLSLPTTTQTIVGTTQTQTLTNKTLTSPSISSPTGIVKGDVGLGNVDNTSDATKNAASVQLTNKDIDGGTASNTSRITLPKNTLSNATSLTRKEGTIVYVTDQAKPYYDTGSSLVAVGSGSGGGASGYNTIQNTDAETDTSNWTESGGTFTRTNTAGELLFGAYSFKWTPSAAQNLRSSAVTIPDGLYGRNCYASVIYKTASTDYTMQILDGSNNVLGSYAMPAASTVKIAPINFVCPTSGTIKLGFVTTASAVQLDFDSAFLGEATNITTSTNVTDWVAYTPTFTGFGTPSNVEFISRRVGGNLEVYGKFTAGTTTATEARITFGFGGTNNNVTSAANPTTIRAAGSWFRNTSSANKGGAILSEPSVGYMTFGGVETFGSLTNQALTKVNGSNISTGDVVSLYVTVPIVGWSAEPAFRPDLASPFGGAKTTGATNCQWSGTSGSYANFSADTDCSAPTVTGTATAPGTKIPGAVFNNIPPGTYIVTANALAEPAFNTTPIQCQFRLSDGTNGIGNVSVYSHTSGDYPQVGVIEGYVTYTSFQSSVTIQVQQLRVSGDGTCRINNANSNQTFEISLRPVTQNVVAPILLGSVTSNSSAAYRMESVSFGGATEGTNNCTADPCTVYRKSGGVSSITRNSTGTYTINFLSGTFSAAPTCTMSCNQDGTGIAICNKNNAGVPTSTAFQFITRNASNTAVDTEATVICMGPN